MKVLWITNIQFPAIRDLLNKQYQPWGGWVVSLAGELVKDKRIELSIASIYRGTTLQKHKKDGITYFLLPSGKYCLNGYYDKTLEKYWRKIIKDFSPNIVHIHGTEFPFGLTCMNACPKQKYVVSIQGLVSVSSEYYYAGIPLGEVFKHLVIGDIIRGKMPYAGRRDFIRRGRMECQYLRKTDNVVGRTNWDYAHIKRINPHAEYYFCNEILRKCFYAPPIWDLYHVQRHSVFISQAGYPIKGFHQLLKAVALLKNDYPTVQIRIAGPDILNSFHSRLKLPGYYSYIDSLVNKLCLQENVIFTGSLDEWGMKEEYRRAHVFVSPSSIENSSNSIGEAQLTGTPCVASFVGGTPDLIRHGETGLLYRFEEYSMLAEHLKKIFDDDILAQHLAENSRVAALERHDPDIIKTRMLEIYDQCSK